MKDKKIKNLPVPQDTSQNEPYDEALRQSEEHLRALFQKAYYEYHADDFLPRKPLDFSFMEESVETKKHVLWRPRILRVAALLLVCGVLTGLMHSFVNSHTAYAARFYLEKAMYRISGKYYASDMDADLQESQISIRIDTMEDLSQAVKFMPELYFPEEIPDGWTLKQLVLTKTLHGDRYAEYTFTSADSRSFCIHEEVLLVYSEVSTGMEGDPVQLRNRTVIAQYDDYMETHAVWFIENNVSVTIGGYLSPEEMLSVADGLEQHKMQE